MADLFEVFGGEVLVNDLTSGNQSDPEITPLSNGGYVVVWWSQSGTERIRAEVFAPDGTSSGEFPVSEGSAFIQAEPAITALDNGGFAVTWWETDVDFSNREVFTRVFNADGSAVTGELLANTSGSGNQDDVSIASLEGGGYIVSWTTDAASADGDGTAIKAQIFNDVGGKVGSEILLNASSASNQNQSQVLGLLGGGFAAVWTTEDGTQDGSGQAIMARFFDAAGTESVAEFVVNTSTTVNQNDADITLLANGNIVVSWTSSLTDASGRSVNAQILAPDGSKVGGEIVLNTDAAGDQLLASIAALSTGGFAAAWYTGDQPQDGSSTAIKAQVFDAAGAKQGEEFLVNTFATGIQTNPSVAGLDGGGFVISWRSGDGSGTGISSQTYLPSTGVLGVTVSEPDVSEVQTAGVAFATLGSNGAVNSSFTYELVSDTTGAFAITGDELVVVDNARLDFETAPEATLVVRSTDINGETRNETIVLGVSDSVNETRYEARVDEITVNAVTTGNQTAPTFVGLDGGGMVAVWFGPEVQARMYDENGDPVGTELTINENTSLQQFEPTATALSGGGFVVTWTEFGGTQNESFDIRGRVFDADGNATGTEFIANTDIASPQRNSDVIGLSDGRFVIAWQTEDATVDGSGQAARARIFDLDGSESVAEFTLNTDTASSQIEPSLSALPSGGFVAVWQTTFGNDIKGQIFDANGGKLGPEFLINDITLSTQSDAVVTTLADGTIVVAWYTQFDAVDGSQAIKARLFDPDGTPQGGEFLVNTDFAGTQSEPAITALDTGGFAISWRSDITLANSGRYAEIKAQFFDASGNKSGTEFLVNVETDDVQRSPTITGLDGGGFLAGWIGPQIGPDIYARWFDPVPLNLPPIAADDLGLITAEDTPITFNVLDNDSDPNGDVLTVTGTGLLENGSVDVSADGNITFTPDQNFNGTGRFQYAISDGNGGTDTAFVEIEVTPLNDAPVANDLVLTTDEDQSIIFDLSGSYSDIENDDLTITIGGPGSIGQIWDNPDGTYIYVIDEANASGQDVIGYTVSDGNGGIGVASIIVNVEPVQDLPTALSDTAFVDEDDTVSIDVLANDFDVDGDSIFISSVADPANGTATENPDGTIQYTPNADFNGQDSFEYTILDSFQNPRTATVTVNVEPINDAPVANYRLLFVDEGATVFFNPANFGSDVDNDPLTFATFEGANNGIVVPIGNEVGYDLNDNFNGIEFITFTLSDGDLESAPQTLELRVQPVNDAPNAAPVSVSGNEDTRIDGQMIGSDPDGDDISFSIIDQPNSGSVAFIQDGSFQYTPFLNFNGTDQFTYQVQDETGLTSTADVTITVDPVNDAPSSGFGSSVATDEDANIQFQLFGTDIENDDLTFVLNVPTVNGSIDVTPDGLATYTPNANFNGQDAFAYFVSAGELSSTVTTVTVDVAAVNAAPVFTSSDTASVEENLSFV